MYQQTSFYLYTCGLFGYGEAIQYVTLFIDLYVALRRVFRDSDSATALEKRAGIEILFNNLQFKEHSISTDRLAISLYGFCLIEANYRILLSDLTR